MEFIQTAVEACSAFVPWIGAELDDTLYKQFERTAGADNNVFFEGRVLQILVDRYHCH